ncbi:calcium-binding protein CML [Spatholobus suberectus]|nr:calcium-binding protein CML [Spatholobus suberectus]
MVTSPIAIGNSDATPNPDSGTKSSMYLKDLDKLKRLFSCFDANNKGKISVGEVDNVLHTFGFNISSKEL